MAGTASARTSRWRARCTSTPTAPRRSRARRRTAPRSAPSTKAPRGWRSSAPCGSTASTVPARRSSRHPGRGNRRNGPGPNLTFFVFRLLAFGRGFDLVRGDVGGVLEFDVRSRAQALAGAVAVRVAIELRIADLAVRAEAAHVRAAVGAVARAQGLGAMAAADDAVVLS